MQQRRRDRRAAVRQHADRRAVDEAVGAGERILDAGGDPGSPSHSGSATSVAALSGIAVEDADIGDTELLASAKAIALPTPPAPITATALPEGASSGAAARAKPWCRCCGR